MSPLDPQSPRTLYLQLADELRAAIRRGDFAPGERITSERELIQQYQTSRTTVRLALGVLKAEGLIVAGHGRGHYVRHAAAVRLPFTRFSRARSEPGLGPWEAATREAGVKGTVRIVAVEEHEADEELAHRLEIAEGAPVILRSRHMYANGHRAQLYDAFYPLDIVKDTDLARSPILTGGVYPALAHIGHAPASATEEVGARHATEEEARMLEVATGAPVLTVVRTTRNAAGRPIEILQVVANAQAITFLYTDLPLDWAAS
jgi:GntR family transcriptional regulator